MRWGILLCVFLLGCDDEYFRDARYIDGTDWKPTVPVKGPSSIPKDLREWDRYFSDSGIQADKTEKSFTPVWDGFSTDPVGDISYFDFGSTAAIWVSTARTGASDEAYMLFTGLPAAITPASTRYVRCLLIDENNLRAGVATISTSGGIAFSLEQVTSAPTDTIGFADVFTDPSTLGQLKGLPAGFSIEWVK